MHNERPTAERMILEAIAKRRLISADYNGLRLKLAPHQLFSRRGDTFIRALNTAKAWRDDETPRVGQFKLEGMGDVVLCEEGFEPLDEFDAGPPRQEDVVLFSV